MPDRIQPGFIENEVEVKSTREQVLHAGAAETTNGNSPAITVGDFTEGLLAIDITAVSGASASAAFVLQTLIDGVWRAVPGVTIAAQTANGPVTVAVTDFGDKIRLAWTLTGTTPSFTFASSFMAKT